MDRESLSISINNLNRVRDVLYQSKIQVCFAKSFDEKIKQEKEIISAIKIIDDEIKKLKEKRVVLAGSFLDEFDDVIDESNIYVNDVLSKHSPAIYMIWFKKENMSFMITFNKDFIRIETNGAIWQKRFMIDLHIDHQFYLEKAIKDKTLGVKGRLDENGELKRIILESRPVEYKITVGIPPQ